MARLITALLCLVALCVYVPTSTALLNATSTWFSGSQLLSRPRVAPPVGTSSATATPGARAYHCSAASATVSTSFYIYGGLTSSGIAGDLWQFSLVSGHWTLLNDNAAFSKAIASAYPGYLRDHKCDISPSDGNLYMFGGYNTAPNNNMWKYDTTLAKWTYLNSNIAYPQGYSIGQGQAHSYNTPSCRHQHSFTAHPKLTTIVMMGGNGYSLTDGVNSRPMNDLWTFDVSINQWTWLAGNMTAGDQVGVYGTIGTGDSNNVPSGRYGHASAIDPATGDVIVFGGSSSIDRLNELWQFSFILVQWTWVSGNQPGDTIAPTSRISTFNTTNLPGARRGHSLVNLPSSNYVALMGGNGRAFDDPATNYDLNDIWLYDTVSDTWAWLVGADSSSITGAYGAMGVPSEQNIAPPRKSFTGICLKAGSTGSATVVQFGGDVGSSSTYYSDMWNLTFADNVVVSSSAAQSSTAPTSSSASATATATAVSGAVTTDANSYETEMYAMFGVLGVVVILLAGAITLVIHNRRQAFTAPKEDGTATTTTATSDGSAAAELEAAMSALDNFEAGATHMADGATVVSNSTEFAMPGFLQFKAGQHFRWNKMIAKGGGGSIYLGEALIAQLAPLGSTIIVKIVGQTRAEISPLISQAFDQEISVMHYLGRHQNIAGLLGWCDSPVAMLMKYYHHGALDKFIKKKLKVKGMKCLFMLDIARGLQFMHNKGVAHCDMKTANILVDQDDLGQMFCVLTDFGIAQMYSENAQLVHAFNIVNLRGVSILYAAPEAIMRFRMKKETPNMAAAFAADMYSVGAIMFEILMENNGWRKVVAR